MLGTIEHEVSPSTARGLEHRQRSRDVVHGLESWMAQCEVAVGDMRDRLDDIEQSTEDTTRDMVMLSGSVTKNSKIDLLKRRRMWQL